MREKQVAILSLLLYLSVFAGDLQAKIHPDSILLNRIFRYAGSIDTAGLDGTSVYTYLRFSLNVKKRNLTLLPVPTMYRIAHGGCREYIGEDYNKIIFHTLDKYTTENLISLSTIPHHEQVMPPILKYLTPHIYHITIFDGYILSPFHISNRRFYRYSTILLFDGTAIVVFKSKIDNTQLVNGSVTVDYASGRIISGDFEGEYDMSRFHLSITMGKEGIASLLPVLCELNAQFKFIGNNISAHYKEYYGMPQLIDESVRSSEDPKLMKEVRPDTLSAQEQGIYDRYYATIETRDTTKSQRKTESKLKIIMWDIIGNHVLNRIRYNINKDQGYFRVNPILNPLYMGYSNRRGFYYKFDLRGAYNFSTNVELSARIKGGYSFKQHQFYIFFPLMLFWNKRKNRYLQVEIRNGDRIYSSSVRKDILEYPPQRNDSIQWDHQNLDEFVETSLILTNHYDISNRFGFKVGLTLRNRHSIDRNSFLIAERPTRYKSVAPSAELEYRPWGWNGPILTLDYERSIKGMMGANIGFERWEFDGQYIHKLASMKAVSLRFGYGFYTHKDKNYFLDYTNFRENNIPGGWNDKWSGEFEMLNSDWYNSSQYYFRANMTYETPILITSRLPWVGHFMEMERLYLSALSVKSLGSYFEIGYGFTTRMFSMGIFTSNNRGRFRNVEFKFGFELFRDW